MKKNILILCCGYPYQTDKGFGYHVSKQLEKMNLPENVELMEVGESASMIPAFIADVEKLIVIDYFQTKDKPGTTVRLKTEEVPVTVDGLTDIAKSHFMDTLGHLKVIGKCPETIFIGVVPQDIQTESLSLTPEIEDKIPKVIDMILAEIQ
jgi:hydrogenase maturation protease